MPKTTLLKLRDAYAALLPDRSLEVAPISIISYTDKSIALLLGSSHYTKRTLTARSIVTLLDRFPSFWNHTVRLVGGNSTQGFSSIDLHDAQLPALLNPSKAIDDLLSTFTIKGRMQ